MPINPVDGGSIVNRGKRCWRWSVRKAGMAWLGNVPSCLIHQPFLAQRPRRRKLRRSSPMARQAASRVDTVRRTACATRPEGGWPACANLTQWSLDDGGLTLIHRTHPALTSTVSGSQHLTNKAHNAPLQVFNLEIRMRLKKKNIRATPSRYEESNRRAATGAQKQRYQLSRSSPVNRARLKPIYI